MTTKEELKKEYLRMKGLTFEEINYVLTFKNSSDWGFNGDKLKIPIRGILGMLKEWEWIESLLNKVEKEAREGKDILDIILTDEDGEICWLNSDEVSSREEAYQKFIEYCIEVDIDGEEFPLFKDVEVKYGHFEGDPAKEFQLFEEEDISGETWYYVKLFNRNKDKLPLFFE